MPNPDYMEDQNEITWENRGTLIDWLLQVHAKFGLLSESLFLTVNLIDRFLGSRPISIAKLQLVGLACFFIATKFEETYSPSVKEIAYLSDKQYDEDEIRRAERYILRILEWDLRAPGPMNWLRRGSKADDCEVHARTIAKYLIEIGLVERRLIRFVPSLISATALWLARLSLGREEWVCRVYFLVFRTQLTNIAFVDRQSRTLHDLRRGGALPSSQYHVGIHYHRPCSAPITVQEVCGQAVFPSKF